MAKKRKLTSSSAKIILVTNQKGGSAKTTTAMNTAAALHNAGERVLLADYDPQNTLGSWYGQADDTNPIPFPYLNLSTPSLDVTTELESRQYDFDYIVIDGQPNLDLSMSGVLLLSDFVLVPLKPSLADLHSTQGMIKEIQLAQAARPDLKFALLLVMVKKGTLLLQYTKDAIRELGFPLCKTMVMHRELHPHTYALGHTVFSNRTLGYRAAAEEATKITEEIINLSLKGADDGKQ